MSFISFSVSQRFGIRITGVIISLRVYGGGSDRWLKYARHCIPFSVIRIRQQLYSLLVPRVWTLQKIYGQLILATSVAKGLRWVGRATLTHNYYGFFCVKTTWIRLRPNIYLWSVSYSTTQIHGNNLINVNVQFLGKLDTSVPKNWTLTNSVDPFEIHIPPKAASHQGLHYTS